MIPYETDEQRESIIQSQAENGFVLIEDKITLEGKYLIFITAEEQSKPIPPTDQERIVQLEQENTLLKAQNQANADRADFHEEVLTEIILAINP